MEVAAFHASEVKNPQAEFPKAIFYATIIILAVFIFGTLSIAIVVPASKISLVAGLMQAVDAFLDPFHLKWATKVFGGLIILGTLAMISTWIVGPSHGLLATAKHGDLPPSFRRTNKVLEGIVSYDRAETNGTYVGQINMVQASSFCGLNGTVWGYHLAKDESIAKGTQRPPLHKKKK